MKDTDKHKSVCRAKTRSGKPCAKHPMEGKRRCRNHGGMSTGPQTNEGKARISKAQLKHGKYVKWRERREKEKAYFSQIRAVMAQAREAGLIED